jgi:hypothetical protein
MNFWITGWVIEKNAMPDAECLRKQASKCLELARKSADPEVIEQLELWAEELNSIAVTVEDSAPADQEPTGSSWHSRT